MNLATLKKLAGEKVGSAGHARAQKWLFSLALRTWIYSQLKERGIDSSDLLASDGVLVKNEAGKLQQADDKRLQQWAYHSIIKAKVLKTLRPKYRALLSPGVLVRPADFLAAFSLAPMPDDYLLSTANVTQIVSAREAADGIIPIKNYRTQEEGDGWPAIEYFTVMVPPGEWQIQRLQSPDSAAWFVISSPISGGRLAGAGRPAGSAIEHRLLRL